MSTTPFDQAFPGLAPLSEKFTSLKVIADEAKSDRIHISLNRPEMRNAIDQEMADELHIICDWLELNPRILIISGTTIHNEKTGTDRGIFASGANIRQLKERGRDDALRGVNSKVFDRIHQLPMPVIAALDGYALGGGAELSYAADFRLGTPFLKMGQPEVGLGITAGAGGLWRLKELVGEPLALELLLTGRILNAEEAKEAKLIGSIHPPQELIPAAHELADKISAQDPLAVQLTKRLFHMPREAHPHVSNIAQAIVFESAAKHERMQAFLDRK